MIPTVGSYSVTASATGANGTAGGSASVTVTNLSPDFSISVSPASRSMKQNNTATYTVAMTPNNGFSGLVTLSASGLPAAFTVTFTPNPATTTATLTVGTVPGYRGTYTLTIQGVNGSLLHTTTATLTVTNH